MHPRIVYVVPLLDLDTEQHFYNLYDLLGRVSQHADLEVIAEKGERNASIPGVERVVVQRFTMPLLRALELFFLIARAVWSGRDRIYVHYSTYGGLAGLLCRFLFGARVFYWNCEENAGHWRPSRSRLDLATMKARLLIEWPTGLVIRLVDRLVTGTPRMATYYQRVYGIGPRRTRVMPNSVDPARFHPATTADEPELAARARELEIPPDAEVALFVHRLSPRKGSRDLPDLMERLARRRPQLFWLIAGDGPDRAWLEGEIRSRGLGARVRILGNVPNRGVSVYYRLSRVLVMPSRQEGFPRVLIEAMASGLPFVATAVGGVEEVAGELACDETLAARGNIEQVADLVERVLADEDLAARLAAEGIDRARCYTPERVVKRFLEITRERLS